MPLFALPQPPPSGRAGAPPSCLFVPVKAWTMSLAGGPGWELDVALPLDASPLDALTVMSARGWRSIKIF